jgi:hypothetical protein
MTVDQPGFEQQSEMARHPGLGLAKNFRQVRHREIAMRQQGENTKAAGFRSRLQAINHPVQRYAHRGDPKEI